MVGSEIMIKNALWIFFSGFLVLLPLANTRSITHPRNLDQIYENLTIANNSLAVCEEIENGISNESQVFYLNDSEYYEDISHYGISSTMFPVCSVEPATPADVAVIMKIIRESRVPFAVKGGGHSLNPGFSSTTGVHIAMQRFRKTIFHAINQTVDIGPGLVWDDVYQSLEPYNISVLGGRLTGVGVGGFTLGGGYGWKSNQYGLAIDNVFEYELVTSNGTIVYTNNTSYPDIFFGLKGGLNNFGIVTNFNVRALPQTQVYGGVLFYLEPQCDAVLAAVINCQNTNRDPKAQLICSISSIIGVLYVNIYAFYDAPTAPENIFKEFTDIPYIIGGLETRSYLSFVQALPVAITDNMRGRFHTVSVTSLTTRLVQKVKQLGIYYTTKLLSMGGTFVDFQIEPFLSTYFDKSQGGAYPHIASSTPLLPICLQFGWQLPVNDEIFINEIQSVANSLLETALEDGQDVGNSKQILYPNYALENTSLSEMYGDNVARLKTIRQAWDPENVMYLTGGFKF